MNYQSEIIYYNGIKLHIQTKNNNKFVNYTKLFKLLTGSDIKFIEFIRFDFFANFVYNYMKEKNNSYTYVKYNDLMSVVNNTNKVFYEYYNQNEYEGIYGPIEMLPLVLILYSPETLSEINKKIINDLN